MTSEQSREDELRKYLEKEYASPEWSQKIRDAIWVETWDSGDPENVTIRLRYGGIAKIVELVRSAK